MEENLPVPERKMHPKSIAVLVLGVLSIIIGYIQVLIVMEIIAFILGIISLLLSFIVNRDMYMDAEKYIAPSKGINKAGRICSIIGIAVSILHTCIWFIRYY